jgi:mRNA interferase RelE/StbE
MARFELQFRESVAKDLRSIPKNDVKRILTRIDKLADDPRADGCEKLTGSDHYRVRQGMYRIIYEIQDDVLVVLVIKVGNRRDVYRGR